MIEALASGRGEAGDFAAGLDLIIEIRPSPNRRVWGKPAGLMCVALAAQLELMTDRASDPLTARGVAYVEGLDRAVRDQPSGDRAMAVDTDPLCRQGLRSHRQLGDPSRLHDSDWAGKREGVHRAAPLFIVLDMADPTPPRGVQGFGRLVPMEILKLAEAKDDMQRQRDKQRDGTGDMNKAPQLEVYMRSVLLKDER